MPNGILRDRSCHCPAKEPSRFFLTDLEKDVAEQRILLGSVENLNSSFNWSEALYEFKSVHIYIRIVMMCTAGILVGSNGNFLAIITASLGYSVVKTNLVSQFLVVLPGFSLLNECFLEL